MDRATMDAMRNYRHREVWLVRHGETEWSKSGQHTSTTDLPLTQEGERKAVALGPILRAHSFAAVFASPLQRATETARLAGFEPVVIDELKEWNYGAYEGLTTPQIQGRVPEWTIWKGPVPGGESCAEGGSRADRVIE